MKEVKRYLRIEQSLHFLFADKVKDVLYEQNGLQAVGWISISGGGGGWFPVDEPLISIFCGGSHLLDTSSRQ